VILDRQLVLEVVSPPGQADEQGHEIMVIKLVQIRLQPGQGEGRVDWLLNAGFGIDAVKDVRHYLGVRLSVILHRSEPTLR
jgi:hypothetical protein